MRQWTKEYRTESRVSFGTLTESVTHVTSSCSEAELKMWGAHAYFPQDVGLATDATYSLVSTSFSASVSPSEESMAGEARWQPLEGRLCTGLEAIL